ncbi:hypothetical protein B0H17DRAFT_1127269 [Mycena rosella]|uniref:Uncharacterized protein n=1 Tax=Mycena rosella TaxID=1033263 RepID=A0AAD7GRH7_MYCRO|nr:hypothetical protein B0H17DRAFT_1127269 [Mycena rosella]
MRDRTQNARIEEAQSRELNVFAVEIEQPEGSWDCVEPQKVPDKAGVRPIVRAKLLKSSVQTKANGGGTLSAAAEPEPRVRQVQGAHEHGFKMSFGAQIRGLGSQRAGKAMHLDPVRLRGYHQDGGGTKYRRDRRRYRVRRRVRRIWTSAEVKASNSSLLVPPESSLTRIASQYANQRSAREERGWGTFGFQRKRQGTVRSTERVGVSSAEFARALPRTRRREAAPPSANDGARPKSSKLAKKQRALRAKRGGWRRIGVACEFAL